MHGMGGYSVRMRLELPKSGSREVLEYLAGLPEIAAGFEDAVQEEIVAGLHAEPLEGLFGGFVPLPCGHAVPLGRLLQVLVHGVACLVAFAELELRLCIALVFRLETEHVYLCEYHIYRVLG